MPFTLRTVAAAAALVAAGAARGGEPYRSAEHHFAAEPPPGWRVMPPDEFRMHALVALQFSPRGSPIRYATGFSPGAGSSAYVLVQVERMPAGYSFDDAERVARRVATQGEQLFLRLVPGAGLRAEPDPKAGGRDRKRVAFRQSMTIPGADASAEGLMVAHLGADRLVCVHACAEGEQFPNWRPAFDAMNDSFRFNPGHEYGAAAAAPAAPVAEEEGFDPSDPVDAMVLGAAGGGLLGLAGAAGIWRLRRKGRRRLPA